MADDTMPEDEDLALPDATADVDEGAGATQSLNIGGEAAPVVERPAPIIRGKLDKHGIAMGTGRRKTAVARVRVKDGSGTILINGRPLNEFFPLERDQNMVKAPLIATEQLDKVDVWVRVTGGGPTGQTGASVLGIARALSARNNALQPKLAEGGYLTRDGRMVERKKYGHKKARRSFQFSKR
jgi:small subunit ribosomal protein S9